MAGPATASAGTSGLAPLRSALAAQDATVGATFQWPWDIARRGGEHFAQVAGVASALAAGAQAVAGSPGGPGIVAAVLADPTSSASTDQVLDSGMFGPAIDAVRADSLLRTLFVGWSAGAQVGLLGGGGGSGVASDVVDRDVSTPVSYGQFKLGVGAQVTAGLLVGALSVDTAHLDGSTCVFEFGAGLVGIGTFVQVIMTDGLDLIGFTLNVGAGGGLASSTGYGSISSG
ncbi:hypothetical protein [Cellulosimicrobium protaetiae]